MSTPKIAPCPFCGAECELKFDSPGYNWIDCRECYYSSISCDHCALVIRAHNKVATRLDPAKILMVLGGTVGNKVSRHGMFHPLFINGIRYAMEKIRDMRDAK